MEYNKYMNHLLFSKDRLAGATLACVTGDPFRVPGMARDLDENAFEISHTREFAVWLSYLEKQPLVIASHGIGGASLSILMEELALLGIKDMLRVGTSGAIQSVLSTGDVIISTASVRLEGVTPFYAPVTYPAVAHPDWVSCLREATDQAEVACFSGITASTDSFYPGQQRIDTKTKYIIPPWDHAIEMWKRLQVLNYEMESSTLFVVGSVLALRTGCLTAVIVERQSGEQLFLHQKEPIRQAWKVAKIALKNWINDYSKN
jgi:uridine phosphorylase